MCVRKGKRSKEKWFRKIMSGGARSGNCRRIKDPRKVGKEGSRKGSEEGSEVGTEKKER
jgi:hypothetical protein